MIRYYEESIDRKNHFCEITDRTKASHFTLNGGIKLPIADLKYTNGGQMPETVPSDTEPLPLPVANFDEENQSEQTHQPNVADDNGPLPLPTMNFDEKQVQKKNQQQKQDDSEPLGLPTL